MSGNERGRWWGSSIPEYFFSTGSFYSQPQISPNGTTLSFLSQSQLITTSLEFFQSSSNVERVKVGEQRVLTSAQDVKIRAGAEYGGNAYCWQDDSSLIVCSNREDTCGISALNRVEIEGHPRPQTLVVENDSNYVYQPTTNKSLTAYCKEERDSMSVVLVDVADGLHDTYVLPVSETFVFDPEFNSVDNRIAVLAWSLPFMSWNKSCILLLNRKNSDENSYYEERLIAGARSTENDKSKFSWCGQPRFSPDGTRLSYVSDEDGVSSQLYIVNLSDGSKVKIPGKDPIGMNGLVSGSSYYLWLTNDELVVTRVNNGFYYLELLDLNHPESPKRLAQKLDAGVFSGLQAPVKRFDSSAIPYKNKWFCCVYSNYYTHSAILLINATTDEVFFATRSGMYVSDTFRKASFTRPRSIHYKARDDTNLYGLLYYKLEEGKEDPQDTYLPDAPLAQLNAPCIAFIHDGPCGLSTPSMIEPFIQYFASKGYVIFAPNYRGSHSFTRQYREAINGRWGELDQSDTMDGINHLIQNKVIDGKRVIVMGGSAGGFTTVGLLSWYPTSFVAGVSMSGIYDLTVSGEEVHLLERHYNTSLIGEMNDADTVVDATEQVNTNYFAKCTKQKFINMSPVTYAHEIVAPLMLIHGEADRVAPIENSERLVTTLQMNGTAPVEYHVYKNAGHTLLLPHTINDLLERIDTFILKHAGNNEQ